MYNYYSELKKLNDNESQTLNQEKEKEIKEQRKRNLPGLVRNYENRIKDFLYKMAKSPLVIKDHQQAISSTRKEHLDQENHKILAGKGFVLKKYKTEKQRLEEHMTINDNIFTSINHVSNGDYGFNKLRALYEESKDNPLKSSLINQPTMRFTPKNALERIYESLSLYSPRKAGKEEILRQKKVVQIKKSSNDDGSQDEDEEKYPANLENPKTTENDYSESINNKTRKRNEKQLNKYEDKRVRIKHDQNSQARHILSDLHERTHFKGASGFTLWKNTSLLKNDVSKPASKGHDMRHKENSKEIFLPKTSDRNGINSVNFNTTNNYLNNTQSSKFDKHAAFENSTHSASYNPNRLNNFKANNINKESSYRFEDYLNNTNDEYNNNYLLYKLDIEEDLAKSNPLLFNLTLNNFKKKFEDRHGADENKIDYIKKIAFQNRDGTKMAKSDELRKTDSYLSSLFERDYKKKFSLLQKDPVTFFEKFKDELEWAEFSKQKLKIDGEDIPISDLDRIARKVLIECNFLHPKSKYNQTVHKSGDGKMMITSGLTVKEFKNKFHLS